MSDNSYQTPNSSSISAPQGLASSPYGEMRDLTTLAKFSKVMLILNIVITVVATVFIMSPHYKNAVASILEGVDDGSEAFEQLVGLGVIGLIILIITVVAVCRWTIRAMANTWAKGKLRPSITPGWAAGWYFIPFANLWKPYEAMTEIWTGIFGPSKSRAILLIWWFSWIISGILERVSTKMDLSTNTDIIDLTSSVLSVIAAVSLIKIIGIVTRDHQSKLIATDGR